MTGVENLTKRFSDFTAVDNINFSVNKGEIFDFVGRNGAGKTTTIKMLTTLLRPTFGFIKINGIAAATQKLNVRESCGIIFQDPSLDVELNTYENMHFHAVLYKIPSGLRKKRVQDLLNFVELWDRRNDLVKTFSGGTKRRLEIARGLLYHPKVLFLDEPTVGLLPVTLVCMFLVALLFTSLSIAIASFLEDMQGFHLIMNFLVQPLFFLSGALLSLNNLPKVLGNVTRVDTLTYKVDGLRNTLGNAGHFNLSLDLIILFGLSFILLSISSYLFSKGFKCNYVSDKYE